MQMNESIEIGKRRIGRGSPAYCIAEVSANHNQDFAQAVRIIEAAKDAGADAVKLQTYTADTMTLAAAKNVSRLPAALSGMAAISTTCTRKRTRPGNGSRS